MSRAPSETPTKAERKVWKVVHERGECAARDAVEALAASDGWSTSTVKTLLRRLVEKGFLRTTRVGNSFLYSPTESALEVLRDEADALLEGATAGTVGPLLAYMVKQSRLSADDLAELKELIAAKEREDAEE
ncbi:MAG: BlaI/MecI/CopY family transcriptional regulator [Planctomycetota bacterium JB042]